ncbi:MAG: hypothetical protein FWF90_14305 [Promicromonosporaceae bacterium]|nr:hypothetical protein [Promicromonosporaceae bacterium]
MKRYPVRNAAVLTAALALTGALTGIAIQSAQADPPASGVCVPSDAWTEEIPAQGEPTIPNPDYVPGSTIDHPAVFETRPLQRWSWNPSGNVPPGQTPDKTDSTPLTDSASWTSNTTTWNGSDPLGVAFSVSAASPTGGWFFWTTQQVQVQAPWTEVIPDQGTPTIPNPDYVEASTIDHPAVVCEDPAPEITDPPGETETPTVDPTDPVVDPTDPPADPADPPADLTDPPAAPAVPQATPSQSPAASVTTPDPTPTVPVVRVNG